MTVRPSFVMLVEDDPDDRELILRVLRPYADTVQVRAMPDGDAALRDLFDTARRGELPRLILLDLTLPGLDGFDVLRRIRADELTQTIPVVVLSSSGEDFDVGHAYDLGANSYLVKPVDPEQFDAVVRAASLYWLALSKPACAAMT